MRSCYSCKITEQIFKLSTWPSVWQYHGNQMPREWSIAESLVHMYTHHTCTHHTHTSHTAHITHHTHAHITHHTHAHITHTHCTHHTHTAHIHTPHTYTHRTHTAHMYTVWAHYSNYDITLIFNSWVVFHWRTTDHNVSFDYCYILQVNSILQECTRTGDLSKSIRVTPIEARSPNKIVLKVKHPVTCLATMAYVYAAWVICVTIFSTGGKSA